MGGDIITGVVLVVIVSIVIFGGITRIGKVTSKLVPAMVVIYVGCVLAILSVILPKSLTLSWAHCH
ncbi:MAG: alanine:cation symporter family protein [Fodinibius sp.]|nr:alanine:cation symporter family protein [Fodinibius sp.]